MRRHQTTGRLHYAIPSLSLAPRCTCESAVALHRNTTMSGATSTGPHTDSIVTGTADRTTSRIGLVEAMLDAGLVALAQRHAG